MRYEDYKIEEMTFTNKEEWTEQEKREVLDTFPETKGRRELKTLCEKIRTDIKEGVIKTDDCGFINKHSAKAYANKNACVYYGEIHFTDSKALYLKSWKVIYPIRKLRDIDYILNMINDIDTEFNALKDIYITKEKKEQRKRDINNYEEANKNRLQANLKARKWLDAIKIEIPTSIIKDTYNGEYYINTKSFESLGTYSRELCVNEYGELKKNNVIISEQTANELSDMVKEMAKEISDIIDIYNGRYKDILRRNA